MKAQPSLGPTERLSARTSFTFLVLAFCVFLTQFSTVANALICGVDDIATLSCGVNNDPGVVRSLSKSIRHVGNPVDVITGAKQQQELDYQAVGSPLHLSRYYHNALVDENGGMGQGWRHSYMVKHYLVDDAHRRIQQADGRWINFTLSESNEDEEVYYPENDGDGYLIDDGDTKWELPDGRVLVFDGSYLAEVHYPHGINLQLSYKNKRLVSVTDAHGRALEIEYIIGRAGLAKFEDTQAGELKGHINAVKLPSGDRIGYQYDVDRNLVSVQSEENQRSQYEYLDARFPSYLTAVSRTVDGKLAKRAWTYGEDGRVIEFNDVTNERALVFKYDKSESGGSTLVTFNHGRQERYTWVDENGGSIVEELAYRLCADCEWKYKRGSEKKVEEVTPTTAADKSIDEAEPLEQKSETAGRDAVAKRGFPFEYPTIEQFEYSSVSSGLNVGIDVQGITYTFHIESNRQGEVIDIYVGSISMGILKYKFQERELKRCYDQPLFVQSLMLPAPEIGCLEDLLQLVEFGSYIEKNNVGQGLQRSAPIEKKGSTTGSLSECLANPFLTCDRLERDLDLALLSACAYEQTIHHCGESWTVVDPESLGLERSLFEEGSFSATLFYNEISDEYVAAFRGTDDKLDWLDNVYQGLGQTTIQYRRAVKLAYALDDALWNLNLTFTGHSLGGGLATAAALAINVTANVYNPAALHSNTISELMLDVQTATDLIQVTTVDGDALTEFQTDNRFVTPAVGLHTQIDAPNADWIKKKLSQSGFSSNFEGVALHSMDAVIAVEEELVDILC